MPDTLEDTIQSWFVHMEGELRGLREAGDVEGMRTTLDTLQRQISAWQILYEPPIDLPHSLGPNHEAKRMPFSMRTIGSNY